MSFYDWFGKTHLPQLFLDQIKLLQNIEFIDIMFGKYDNDEKELMKIINKNGKKLKRFSCSFYPQSGRSRNNRNSNDSKTASSKLNFDLAILYLYNCQYIKLDGILFNIIFTNKCKKLLLNSLKNINKKWCDNIVNNCDFTNIESLQLHNISFDNSTMTKKEKQVFIDKLGSELKCGNLKRFSIQEPTEDVLSIWKVLIPVIIKNDVLVELVLHNIEPLQEKKFCDRLLQFIEQNNCCVGILWTCISRQKKNSDLDSKQDEDGGEFEFYKKLLSIDSVRSSVEHLSILVSGTKRNDQCDVNPAKENMLFDSLLGVDDNKYYKQLKSLLIFSVNLVTIDEALDLLSIESKITKNVCFVSVDDIGIMYNIDDKDYKIKYEKVLNLIANMIKRQVAVSISIDFKTKFKSKKDKDNKRDEVQTVFNDFYKQLFVQVFGKYATKVLISSKKGKAKEMSDLDSNVKVSNQYKHPKTNKYCQCLVVPQFEFSISDEMKEMTGNVERDDDLFYRWHDFQLASLTIETVTARATSVD